MNICVFASGKGSNFISVLKGLEKSGHSSVKLLIADRPCLAVEKAKSLNVRQVLINPKDYNTSKEHSAALSNELRKEKIDLICLAGYLSKIPDELIAEYLGKIINIHPSLLPAFGGKGFYGENVHRAAIEKGVRFSGFTVHFVDAKYDNGSIIMQKAVEVSSEDNAQSLGEKIAAAENLFYPYAVELVAGGFVRFDKGRTQFSREMPSFKSRSVLISVSDKTGLKEFAAKLNELGITIIATGGTYKTLIENSIPAVSVETLTGASEMLDGRVKTLNNDLFAGMLFKREDEKHCEDVLRNFIFPIDIAVVNLYPFSKVALKSEAWSEELIENIDIGGVALLRAAAKNYKSVAVVCDKEDYSKVTDFLAEKEDFPLEFKKELAVKAFKHTADYDAAVFSKLSGAQFLKIEAKEINKLRYGENPHQKASLFSQNKELPFEKLGGKELSYNNLLDIYGSFLAVSDFQEPACVIFKHVTPCAMARGMNISDAFLRAWKGDPLSAFGGIIAFNGIVDSNIAEIVSKKFMEVIVASDFTPEALGILKKKPNLRIIKFNRDIRDEKYIKSIGAEILVCEADKPVFEGEIKTVSGNINTQELEALKFAFTCVKHIRSNAIVLCDGFSTLGIGAGQMSRVDSVFMAGQKYSTYLKDNEKPEFLCLASDAFFPFEDAIEQAAAMGVKAIIQPGGSVRDEHIIAAANKLGIKMAITGIRHFKH